MARRKRKARPAQETVEVASDLRIIGGKFRGSRLEYGGDRTTRPMKHRVREAIFNLLGTDVEGKHAIDLFAGTGAIGLEALSRGAMRATFIERHVPTARIVRANIERLGLADQTELHCTSAFLWARQLGEHSSEPGNELLPSWTSRDSRLADSEQSVPWLVFCSPPYDFFVDRQAEMVGLIGRLLGIAPQETVFVVESDERFDFNLLPTPGEADPEAAYRAPPGAWRVRDYPPARIGILRLEDSA